MNRYQLEVAEMDRRHQRLLRTLSFAGAASLVALALWSAGLRPAQWWAAAQRLWSDDESTEHVAASVPVAALPVATAPAAVADPKVLQSEGTDSSISSRPKPLYLVATRPGRNRNEGTARIGTSRANPQTYIAGALLVNGARMAEIHRDYVVLERDGKRVELYMDTLPAKAQRSVDDLIMVGGTQPKAPMPPVTREVLTDYMRPSPVFKDELVRGYQVYPGRRAGVFAQLGLRPGDVITSINDAPIVDGASAIELLKEITNGMSIIVRVERNGKAERLVLDGTLITNDLERHSSSAAAAAEIDLTGA